MPPTQLCVIRYGVAVLAILAALAVGWGYGRAEAKAKVQGHTPVAKPVSSLLIPKWNPKSVLGEILRKYANGERILAVAQLIENTPVNELASLIQLAASCPDSAVRRAVTDFAYAKWVADDPQAALAFALPTMREGKPENTPISNIFAMWARNDPHAALAAALKLDDAAFRQDAVTKIFNNWVRRDDALEGLAALKALPPGSTIPNEMKWFFQRWSEVDPLAAWANVDKIESEDTRTIARGIILSNLALSDPIKAFNLLRELPSNQQLPLAYHEIFQTWARLDPNAAFAALQGMSAGTFRQTAIEAAFNAWSESDPAAALSAAQTLPAAQDREHAFSMVLANYAMQDPEHAADFIVSLPPGADRNNLIKQYISGTWADADPANALAWLDKNVSGNVHDEAVGDVLNKLGKTDATAAMAYIAQLPTGALHDKYLQTAVGNWAKADAAAALAWVQDNLTGDIRELALSTVLPIVIEADPQAEIGYVMRLPDGPLRDSAIVNLASALAQQDIRVALEWVKNLPSDISDQARHDAMANIVVKNWAAIDPAGAAYYAETLPTSSSDFNTIASGVADVWAKSDYQAAFDWAKTLPQGYTQSVAVSAALFNMSQADPAAAWDEAVKQLETNDNHISFASIVNTWSQTDPGAAAHAVAALPAGSYNTENVASLLVTTWMSHDPDAAGQWVADLPSGELKSAAAARFNQLQQAYSIQKSAGGLMMMTGHTVTVIPNGSGPVTVPLQQESSTSGGNNSSESNQPSGQPDSNNGAQKGNGP